MILRKCFVAGFFGCLGAMAPAANAQDGERGEPRRINLNSAAPSQNPNQDTAEAVVSALTQNPLLKGYKIDVVVVDGVAELHGKVIDASQRSIARQTAKSVAGVADVRDHLVQGDVIAAQDLVPDLPGVGGFPPSPQQLPGGSNAPGIAYPTEPTAAFHGTPGMLPNPQYQPPPLPPYAWPTYAPYNNYSRVAQPTMYSHSQWPFIGPMYPYPKVPLGWRRVTLEWQDGSWWYGRESTSHAWWKVRYW